MHLQYLLLVGSFAQVQILYFKKQAFYKLTLYGGRVYQHFPEKRSLTTSCFCPTFWKSREYVSTGLFLPRHLGLRGVVGLWTQQESSGFGDLGWGEFAGFCAWARWLGFQTLIVKSVLLLRGLTPEAFLSSIHPSSRR